MEQGWQAWIIIVGDEDGRVAFIENTGKNSADGTPQFLPPRYFQQEADEVKCGALATPVGVDWDGDGAMDIVSGNSAGYILFFKNLSAPGVEKPKWAAPKYLEADGKIDPFHGWREWNRSKARQNRSGATRR